MKQTILILTFVLTTFIVFGQKQHLEPARDFKQYEGVLKEYYDNVFPLLYKNYSEKPIECLPFLANIHFPLRQ
jgi:hypothetical protein